MKTALCLNFLFLFCCKTFSQKGNSNHLVEVNKKQFDTCEKVQYLAINQKIKKQSGKLIIPISEQKPKILTDNNSDTDFKEYNYLGDIRGTSFYLIKKTEYNDEEFYVINSLSGRIDTLIGQPVFSANLKDFACINNPGTDEHQKIQICEIKNGKIKTRLFLDEGEHFFGYINCIERNSLLIKDYQEKYWKLTY